MGTEDVGPTQELQKQLEEQQRALEKAEQERADAQSRVEDAKAEVKALQALISELGKAKDAYEAAHPDLVAQSAAHKEFVSNETKCLEQILGDTVEDVVAIVEGLQHELHATRAAMDTAGVELAESKKAASTAEAARDTARQTLDDLKNMVATIENRHKRIDAIKRDVKAAHDAERYSLAYWIIALTKRLQEALAEEPDLMAPESLPGRIQAAWTNHEEAEKALAQAIAAVAEKEKRHVERKAAYEQRKKNLERDIRAELGKAALTQTSAA
jgi:hypothetical protein